MMRKLISFVKLHLQLLYQSTYGIILSDGFKTMEYVMYMYLLAQLVHMYILHSSYVLNTYMYANVHFLMPMPQGICL